MGKRKLKVIIRRVLKNHIDDNGLITNPDKLLNNLTEALLQPSKLEEIEDG